jgi:hypothetical protein
MEGTLRGEEEGTRRRKWGWRKQRKIEKRIKIKII